MWKPRLRLSSRLSSWILAACLGAVAVNCVACDKLLTKKAAKEETDSDEDDGDHKKASKKESDDDEKPAAKQPEGRFVYKQEAPTKAEHKSFEALFKDNRMSGVVKGMELFALPQNVPVFTADIGPCAVPNAFYMPSKHAIFLCYPMAKAAYENFVAMGKSDQEASNLTRDAMTFVLLHEMGHALIGELGLGVTGKEEDAVDELATLILIENGKHDMAIAGTYALVLLHQFQGKGKPTPFFDEHSVSEARLYDVFCMILGSNPKKFADEILRDRPELKRRAPKCPGTYQKIDKAWTTLLAPHKRKSAPKNDD
jgi:hypothetical protein